MTDVVQPKLLGARVRRVEDPRYLIGRAQYVADIRRPGTLHAAFVRSDLAHAEVEVGEVQTARAAPGVHAVITGADVAGRVGPITCDSMYPSWQPTEFPCLADGRVRFAGEAVAVVVADDRYLAEDAAQAVEVRYSPLPVVDSVETALGDDAPRVHDAWEDNFYVKRHFVGGEVDAAFADAHGTLELDLVSRRHSGIPLENRCCVAEYDVAEGVLTLWTSTQIPHLVRTGLADCLDLPENRIRVLAPDVGGGFGIKGHLFPEEVAVAFLALETGRPIKWVEDRREHLLASIHAREHYHHVQVAYEEDGTIVALRARIYVDCGAYSVYPWTSTMDTGMALGILPGPYRIRNYECEAYSVATNKCPLGPYRGVARPAACFTIERVVDEVSRVLGLDPIEVRERNLVRADEFPYTSVTGLVYDSGSFAESIVQVCEDADYEGMRRQQARARDEGRLLGIGLACFTEQTAHTTTEFIKRGVPIIFGYEAATVRMDPSGTVLVQISTHSHGQGQETTMAQITADRLSLPLEAVRVTFGDTASTPYGMGTFASRAAVLTGGACHRAAAKVGDMLLRFGAHVLEADAADVELVAGAVAPKGAPERAVPIRDLARWAYHRPEKLPEGMEPLLEAVASYDADPGTGTFANSAQIALIELDTDTGGIEILRYVVVEDCGRMINPLIVDGQVHGGVAQGIGGAILEELVYDAEGQLLTTSLMDYLLPAATDVPRIEVSHIETPSPFTIEGIKGMGEGGAIAPGPVLAAAVQDALRPLGHVFVNELPLSPDRVRRYIERAREPGERGG